MPKKNVDEKAAEQPVEVTTEEVLTAGFAIEGNLVILNVTKLSSNIDLSPQGRSKSSNWVSFEPNGLLPIAIELQDFDFLTLEDGSRALSEQGGKDLFGKVAMMGVPGTRASYNGMLQREENF